MHKRILTVGLVVVLTAGLLIGCGQKKETSTDKNTQTPTTQVSQETGKLKDGIYFAQEDKFSEKSGWKYVLTLEVKDGKIAKVDWNGAHIKGGKDKKTQSKEGIYGMKEKGKAIAEWHEQAEKVEAFLVEKQDVAAITLKDDTTTDAVSGATIKVGEFVSLTKKALEKGPIGAGQYKDGNYTAEEKAFDEKSGWKYTIDMTVINGYIVAVDWNGVHKDGGDDKDTQSKDGRYGMKEKGKAIAEWHEQAEKVEAFLLEKQDPAAVTLKDGGTTDAVSGATIKVNAFVELAKEALAKAK